MTVICGFQPERNVPFGYDGSKVVQETRAVTSHSEKRVSGSESYARFALIAEEETSKRKWKAGKWRKENDRRGGWTASIVSALRPSWEASERNRLVVLLATAKRRDKGETRNKGKGPLDMLPRWNWRRARARPSPDEFPSDSFVSRIRGTLTSINAPLPSWNRIAYLAEDENLRKMLYPKDFRRECFGGHLSLGTCRICHPGLPGTV